MQIRTLERELASTSSWVNLYFLGDTHIGTVHHDRKRWLADIQTIASDPDALWLHCGDAVEAIVLSDPRFEPREIAPEFLQRLDELPYAQIEQFVADVQPIADKCIGLMSGNHEREYARRHYGGLIERACRMLWGDVLDENGRHPMFLGDTAFIRMTFRCIFRTAADARTLVVFAQHGCGAGRKPGAKLNNLADTAASFDADIYVRGHVHERLVWRAVKLSARRRGAAVIEAKENLYILAGSYYRGYDLGVSSYIERQCYPPRSIGCIRIRFQPLKGTFDYD